jgi:hypothetical protein
MGRSLGLLFVLTLSAVVACAKPIYLSGAGISPDGHVENRGQALGSCQAKFSSGKCVAFAWETSPSEEGFGSFIFQTFRPNIADGSPIPEDLSLNPRVVLWMPGMGHGSSPVTVERIDIGTFRASKVSLYMHGQWEIRFQLKDGNEIKDHATININF